MYEIPHLPVNPACTRVSHICQMLKNGTGFQATCKNMYLRVLFASVHVMSGHEDIMGLLNTQFVNDSYRSRGQDYLGQCAANEDTS